MEAMRTMYGEEREYIEDMFSVDIDLEVKTKEKRLGVNKLNKSLDYQMQKWHRNCEFSFPPLCIGLWQIGSCTRIGSGTIRTATTS